MALGPDYHHDSSPFGSIVSLKRTSDSGIGWRMPRPLVQRGGAEYQITSANDC